MFDKYPTLFKERADCLNHLFCTIGNSYEWVGGELVDMIKELGEIVTAAFFNKIDDWKQLFKTILGKDEKNEK